jgi:hypothetical protein
LADLPKWIREFVNSLSALGKFGAHRGEFVRVAWYFAPFFGEILRVFPLLYIMMPVGGSSFFYEFDFLDLGS